MALVGLFNAPGEESNDDSTALDSARERKKLEELKKCREVISVIEARLTWATVRGSRKWLC